MQSHNLKDIHNHWIAGNINFTYQYTAIQLITAFFLCYYQKQTICQPTDTDVVVLLAFPFFNGCKFYLLDIVTWCSDIALKIQLPFSWVISLHTFSSYDPVMTKNLYGMSGDQCHICYQFSKTSEIILTKSGRISNGLAINWWGSSGKYTMI